MNKIVRWDNGETIIEGEGSLKELAEKAAKDGVSLDCADLKGAYLRGAKLRGAKMRVTDMRGAKMRATDMRGAKMRATDMRGAKMRGADMRDTKLIDADLCFTDMRDADLSDAGLTDADLTNTKLWDTIGDDKYIKSIDIDCEWKINYTKDFLQIGCEGHLIRDWKEFDDDRFKQMDYDSLEFWKKHKQKIMEHIKSNPAEQ